MAQEAEACRRKTLRFGQRNAQMGAAMRTTDLVIVGGGPAGMAAALAAYEKGIRDILILERDKIGRASCRERV